MAGKMDNGAAVALGLVAVVAAAGAVARSRRENRSMLPAAMGVAALAGLGFAGGSRGGSANVTTFEQMTPENRAKVCGALQGLMALLRALQIETHEGHWTVKGGNYYGDHLLLQRIYAGGGGSPVLQDEIDGLGERTVAYCGASFVDSPAVLRKTSTLVESWRKESSDPIKRALIAEEALQFAVRETYDALRATGSMPLGMDDFLMGLSSAHDTNRYLLQRRLAE